MSRRSRPAAAASSHINRKHSAERLSRAQLAEHLVHVTPEIRRRAMKLRRTILKVAPGASEAVKFHVLSYHRPRVPFGAIGGNICMLEVRQGRTILSFIHGASLPDPHALLRGSGRAKRWVAIDSTEAAADRRIVALIRAAARLSKLRSAQESQPAVKQA